MTGPLYRLGGFCSRHHWPVIGLWIAAVIAIAVVANVVGEKTSDNLTLPGTGSTSAQNLLSDHLPTQANGTNPVVIKAETGKITDSKNKQAVEDTVKSLRKVDIVQRAVSPFSDAGKGAISKDKKIAYISVTLTENQGDLTDEEAEEVVDAESPAEDAGLKVATGGYLGQAVSKADTESSEAIGLAAAVVILMFAFGTVTAMLLPIVTAVLGLVASLAIIKLLGHVIEVPSVAPTLATMIGLGVGIDYALFIVTRHKLQLKDGMEMRESIARAAATAGGAVVFAGITVVIALVSLVFSGIPFVGNMGYSAAVAVLVAVSAAVTLLPALLGALGEHIHSLRVQLGRTHPDDHQPHGWARWARGVVNRPWRSLVASVGILIVLSLPVLDLQLGASDNGELPKSTTARQAFDLMSEGFGPGSNGPLLIGVELGSPAKPDQSQIKQVNQKQDQLNQQIAGQEQQLEAQGVPEAQAQQQVQQQTASQSQQLAQQKQLAESPATDTRLTDLENAIKKDPGIKSVSPATVDKKGTVAVFTAVMTTAPSDPDTIDTVNRLRDTVVPKASRART
jgi:putative drug exporter of the RND superfamily